MGASVGLGGARSTGLGGATHGANSAAARRAKSTTAETIATGERRRPYARSPSHQRARRDGAATLAIVRSRNTFESWCALDDDPFELVDVVRELHQVDALLHSPGKRLLVQRDMPDIIRMDLE